VGQAVKVVSGAVGGGAGRLWSRIYVYVVILNLCWKTDMRHKVLDHRKNSKNILENPFSIFSAVSCLIEVLCY
jgi:hypothetical protein